MAEDQSVVGRRRIYYDPNGGEALICSDSEEEIVEDEEEKKEFVESEDYILRLARYETLSTEDNAGGCSNNGNTEENSQCGNSLLEKDLEAALDSFDNLFCRRCLVFDCRLHGCSQDLVFPVLKSENFSKDSSSAQAGTEEKCSGGASSKKKSSARKRMKCNQSESASSNAQNISESSDSDNGPGLDAVSASHLAPQKTKPVGRDGIGKRNSKRVAEHVLACIQKRQKKTVASDSGSIVSVYLSSNNMLLTSILVGSH
ncbi:hypothetical protein RIF29_20813 [Crotalaria pallida]|uniref:EZH1/2 MCSS domain-containing protein n=1 Tax=Crotalaria pallida TaxID=3830 RepID=A0AAN9F5E6_CROPI